LRAAQTADHLPPDSPYTIDPDVADAFMLASAVFEDLASPAGLACSMNISLLAVAGKLSEAQAKRPSAPPGRPNEEPRAIRSAADPVPSEASDKNSQVAAILREEPHATCMEVARRVGLSASRIRNLASWKENKAGVRNRRVQAGMQEGTNKEEIIKIVKTTKETPSDNAAAVDNVSELLKGEHPEKLKALERSYINQLDPAGRKRFAKLNPDEKVHEILASMLTGQMGALDERAYTPGKRARRARTNAKHE
jgi:hypothetical protein